MTSLCVGAKERRDLFQRRLLDERRKKTIGGLVIPQIHQRTKKYETCCLLFLMKNKMYIYIYIDNGITI